MLYVAIQNIYYNNICYMDGIVSVLYDVVGVDRPTLSTPPTTIMIGKF